MRLLFTSIFYLGLLRCPASVFATPIRTSPDPTEGHSTRALRVRGQESAVRTEYLVEVKLRHQPRAIASLQAVASDVRDGVEFELAWILPVYDAHKENRRLDPATVPDEHSTFRVTKLSFESSSTDNPERIGPQAEDSQASVSPDASAFWLDITVLHPNGSTRAHLVIRWINPKVFRNSLEITYLWDFFKLGAFEGQAGYGDGEVKDLLASISRNDMTLYDGTTIQFVFRLMHWSVRTSKAVQTSAGSGRYVFSFQ
ncbi:hypothetical protein F5880DRAFT_1588487 [Lentinula raphanica]|nr:hypothetical protein F5880DRAFT_1588487 [Lentinula raphanica]